MAPLYDLICTLAYPEVSKKMAMKIGDQYHIENITLRDWEKFAATVGLSKSLVKEKIGQLAEKILHELPQISQDYDCKEIQTTIRQQCLITRQLFHI